MKMVMEMVMSRWGENFNGTASFRPVDRDIDWA